MMKAEGTCWDATTTDGSSRSALCDAVKSAMSWFSTDGCKECRKMVRTEPSNSYSLCFQILQRLGYVKDLHSRYSIYSTISMPDSVNQCQGKGKCVEFPDLHNIHVNAVMYST
jgi:hypothetical protein